MSKEQNLNGRMKKLCSLTKAFNAAPNAGMKLIWTKQWNKLIQQYALDIKVKDIFKKEGDRA
jgi:late competence protein required for DNA uptake (superfamily II DNA/RNA helicase)